MAKSKIHWYWGCTLGRAYKHEISAKTFLTDSESCQREELDPRPVICQPVPAWCFAVSDVGGNLLAPVSPDAGAFLFLRTKKRWFRVATC